jgi:hypothetical protein
VTEQAETIRDLRVRLDTSGEKRGRVQVRIPVKVITLIAGGENDQQCCPAGAFQREQAGSVILQDVALALSNRARYGGFLFSRATA